MRLLKAMIMCTAIMMASQVATAQDFGESNDSSYIFNDTGEVDWPLVEQWAQVVDTFVDEKGVTINVYLDLFEEIMWEAPAAGAGLDGGSRTVLLTPNYLKFDYTGGGSLYWYRSQGDLVYAGTCGFRNCVEWRNTEGSCPENVDRVRANAYTPLANDYCDQYYLGKYDEDPGDGTAGGWADPDSSYCVENYWWTKQYYIDEEDDIIDYDYNTAGQDYVVEFRYRISGTSYKLRLICTFIPE